MTRAATDAEVDALLAQAARPPLGQLVSDARRYLEQALAVLRRDFDPASLGDVDQVQARLELKSAEGFVLFAQIGLETLAPGGALALADSPVRVPGGRLTEETDGPRTGATAGVLNTNTELEKRR